MFLNYLICFWFLIELTIVALFVLYAVALAFCGEHETEAVGRTHKQSNGAGTTYIAYDNTRRNRQQALFQQQLAREQMDAHLRITQEYQDSAQQMHDDAVRQVTDMTAHAHAHAVADNGHHTALSLHNEANHLTDSAHDMHNSTFNDYSFSASSFDSFSFGGNSFF